MGKHGPLRILLAEDDAGVRETVAFMLDDLGHQVLHMAEDGREVLAYLATEEASGLDLVITDFNMPGASGEEVTRAAKQLGIKVILMSGEAWMSILKVAEAAGVDKFLYKPFQEEALQQAIAELFPEPQ